MDDKYKVKVLMLKGEKGYKGDKGPKGDKGDKGDPLTFYNLTDSQKHELMTNLSTYMKKEEGSLTVEAGNTMIQTNITTYTEWSMLFVFANGVALSKDDYEILSIKGNHHIVLKTKPKENMTIDYVCYNLIEFAKDDYDKLPKGPKGDKGDKGDTGPQGPAGSIENLEVGGRNLLTFTNDITANNGWGGTDGWNVESETYRGMKVYSRVKQWSGLNKSYGLNEGDTVTYSFYAKSDLGGTRGAVIARKSDNTTVSTSDFFSLTTNWKRYFYTFKATEKASYYFSFEKSTDNTSKVYFCGPKLETNLTPTDWTPAPEDIENEITTKVEDKLSNCDVLLNTTFSSSGTINIPVSKTYSFYTIIIEGDADNGITTTIPKYAMDNYNTPFYLNVQSLLAPAYTAKAQGSIYNNKISVKSVSLTQWTQVGVTVFGVY